MLMLKLRQARLALRDGRLEEAAEILQQSNARAHRQGQDLATELIASLVRRGRAHLEAGRIQLAAVDAERAVKIGGESTDAAQLRSDAAEALHREQRNRRQVDQALEAARMNLARGLLHEGQQILQNINGESRAVLLMHEINGQRSQLEVALTAAETCRAHRDLPGALRHLAQARKLDAADGRVIALAAALRDELLPRTEDAFNDGHLHEAAALAEQFIQVDPDHPAGKRISNCLALCRQAWQQFNTAEYARAADLLREATSCAPKAVWLSVALEHIESVQSAANALRAGPMGNLVAFHNRQESPAPASSVPVARKVTVQGEVSSLPQRFCLQVDGAGTYIVLRQATVKIGSISSSHPVDLGLIADPTTPPATIQRADEDYFVHGPGVMVNDKPASGKLLASQDRIGLGLRARMIFCLPSAASTSAVLELSGVRMARGDVRKVILMDRDIVCGPGSATHVRLDGISEGFVLHVKQDGLHVETKQTVLVNGAPFDRSAPLAMGAHVRVGDVSFVIGQA